jgi:hypothetical protein
MNRSGDVIDRSALYAVHFEKKSANGGARLAVRVSFANDVRTLVRYPNLARGSESKDQQISSRNATGMEDHPPGTSG